MRFITKKWGVKTKFLYGYLAFFIDFSMYDKDFNY